MNAKELKEYLVEDRTRLETVLEAYDFHGFNYNGDDFRCALPDGRNRTSVSIKLNETLLTSCFSSGNEYRGDLIGFIENYTEKSFKEVIRDLHKILGLKNSNSGFKKSNKVDLLSDLRKYKKNNKLSDSNNYNKLYGTHLLKNYVKIPHKQILQEHISSAVYEQFNLCFDIQKDRIIFPHYDWEHHNMLVGIVGRTTMDAFVANELGVPKYWNYIKGYKKTHNLYGYSNAIQGIAKNKMVIFFEGEKSVLKQFTMNKGEGFSVSVGGHEINKSQVDFIVKNTDIDTEIVIAFDKDVMDMTDKQGESIGEKYLIEQCEKFRPYRQTSYIFDSDNKLTEKGAPVDEGILIWNELLKNRKMVETI